jgi:hypothetical protein
MPAPFSLLRGPVLGARHCSAWVMPEPRATNAPYRRAIEGRRERAARSSIRQRARSFGATDILLTRSVYRIGSGWACRAKPERGAVSRMVPPNPRCRSFPRSAPVAPPDALRLLWRIVLRSWRPKSSAKSRLLRCCGSRGRAGNRACWRGPRAADAGAPMQRHFFDTGNAATRAYGLHQ